MYKFFLKNDFYHNRKTKKQNKSLKYISLNTMKSTIAITEFPIHSLPLFSSNLELSCKKKNPIDPEKSAKQSCFLSELMVDHQRHIIHLQRHSHIEGILTVWHCFATNSDTAINMWASKTSNCTAFLIALKLCNKNTWGWSRILNPQRLSISPFSLLSKHRTTVHFHQIWIKVAPDISHLQHLSIICKFILASCESVKYHWCCNL